MALKADSSGIVTGAFFVPAGIPVGAKSVKFKGTYSSAEAIYRAEGFRTISTRQTVETITTNVTQGADPWGQIVTLPFDAMISGVDIWLTKIGNPNNAVIVQWRGVEGGVPSQEIYAEKWLSGEELQTGKWLGFDFDNLVLSRADKKYAYVILTEDADHEIAVARLGEWNLEKGGWVTSQPYTGGSAVKGADDITWLAQPDIDITGRVRAIKLENKVHKLSLGMVAVKRLSDVIVSLVRQRPEGTEVELELILPSGQRHTCAPETALALTEYIDGNVTVNVTLRGTERMTPVLHKDAQLILGTLQEEANYVSRFMSAGTGSRQKVVLDAYTPGNSGFAVRGHTGGTAENPTWGTLNSDGATQQGDGLVEHELSQKVDAPETRFEITLKGSPASRPSISSLRSVVTPDV